jgi:hypothetical protein
MKQERFILLAAAFVVFVAVAHSQTDLAASTLTRGKLYVSGHEVPYVIRRLPVSSFPELPEKIAAQLEKLGCMIPQTYEAHRPENVVRASLERAGSSDWAVLCSSAETVQLMVFFESSPTSPIVLSSQKEIARLKAHDPSGVLGFAWGIDPASPGQVREAQSGTRRHVPMLDHDALADVFVERTIVFHFFSKNAWKVIETGD